MLLGRSFKYHRPRGLIASGAEEPNALMGIGAEDRDFRPNQNAAITELYEGLIAQSQNHWPSLEFDIGAINSLLSRFLPAGFYYKMFIHPRPLWKHFYEPLIRKAAGLGKAPTKPDTQNYEHFYDFFDVVVIGGGIAGLMTTKRLADAGVKVLLIEQSAHWGGRAPADNDEIDSMLASKWIGKIRAYLAKKPNATLRNRTICAGIYDHTHILCEETLPRARVQNGAPYKRIWKVRAKKVIAATGAIERPIAFPNNDIPGVMLASALRDYLVNYGVAAGKRALIVTNNDSAYHTALYMISIGLKVAAIIDTRARIEGELPRKAKKAGIRILNNTEIYDVVGKKRVQKVRVYAYLRSKKVAKTKKTLIDIPCDTIAMSGGWSPVVHHWCHCGGKLTWDYKNLFFRPDPEKPPRDRDGKAMVAVVGAADGHFNNAAILEHAARVAGAVAGELGASLAPEDKNARTAAAAAPRPRNLTQPIKATWIMPADSRRKKRGKMWVDFQNDVKVSDIDLAALEGYESVEHTKRYTTLGMATDQGKTSNVNGLAVLSSELQRDIATVGTTTFRPPYSPISLGAIAGEAHGARFAPVRKTAIHSWHDAHNARWEPVAGWRRPYCYPLPHETTEQAVHREVRNTRNNVGIFDGSTLGKLIVKGRDAGKFLDMLYTNMMSTLGIGKCRYGLMCNEEGFLIDDGVVARLDAQTYLCHTTSGGADSIHAHMERWLQTEWWDWEVFVVNATEQFSQIAVVGPNAGKLLEKAGGMDVSAKSLPFMHFKEGQLAGIQARVFRISFTGDLSYEIAIPASKGLQFWERLLELGKSFNIGAFGTEALHIMRAEKGFIMIGDESDGTTTPQDLGLGWAISKKKSDYIGKRAHARPFMQEEERWQLVGLKTLNGAALPEGIYAVDGTKNANKQKNVIGRVTSSYYSPTLGYGIAMGLVSRGMKREGEILKFKTVRGRTLKARIVSPVFFDKEGKRQNG